MGWAHVVHWFPLTPLSCVAFPLHQAAGLDQKILSLGSHELKHSGEEATLIMHKLPRLQTIFPPQRVLLSFSVTGQDLSRCSICNTELFRRSHEQAKGQAGCCVRSSIWASGHWLCPGHGDFPELGHSSLDWTVKGNYLIAPWKLHLWERSWFALLSCQVIWALSPFESHQENRF